MKWKIFGLSAALVLVPVASFAGMEEWQEFMSQQSEKRAAFDRQLQQDKEDFLRKRPDIAATLDAQAKSAEGIAQQQAEARRQRLLDYKAQRHGGSARPEVVQPAVSQPVVKPIVSSQPETKPPDAKQTAVKSLKGGKPTLTPPIVYQPEPEQVNTVKPQESPAPLFPASVPEPGSEPSSEKAGSLEPLMNQAVTALPEAAQPPSVQLGGEQPQVENQPPSEPEKSSAKDSASY